MKNNVVVFDLDGTFINEDNEVIGGKKTLQELTDLQEMGCTLAVCTGRLDHDVIKIANTYDLPMYHRISQNGAVIYTDNICEAHLLDKQEALSINAYLEEVKVRVELNTISNRYWKTERDPDFPKELYDSHRITASFEDILQYEPAVLFLVIADAEVLSQIALHIEENYSLTKAVMTSATSLEILNVKASKGNAIREVYPDATVYAIGDSPNDFDMLSKANVGYIVSSCHYPIDCIQKDNILEALVDIRKRVIG